jgi:hypothetical protein
MLRVKSGMAGMENAGVATRATGIFASAGNREVEASPGLFATVQQGGPSTLEVAGDEAMAPHREWHPPMAAPAQHAVSALAGTTNKAMLSATTANLSARHMP